MRAEAKSAGPEREGHDQRLGSSPVSVIVPNAHGAESLRDTLEPIKHLSTRKIAAVLNERGVETARGGKWQSMTVARLLDRLAA